MARHAEALAHSGDAEATERFLRSLEESPEHIQMCRGYLLYYHDDLAPVRRRTIFANQFTLRRYQRSQNQKTARGRTVSEQNLQTVC